MSIQASEIPESNLEGLAAREGMNEWCGVKDCTQPQFHSTPLCEEHAYDMWVEIGFHHMDIRRASIAHQRHNDRERAKAELFRERLGLNNAMTERRQSAGVIYYLQVEDQIKIGYTANLSTRLKAYPPMAQLRATHPGTRETESQMHAKFAAYLAGRNEWFHTNDELDQHISTVRDQFKQDGRVIA